MRFLWNEYDFEILNYQNIIVSSILILFVPRNIKIPIEDLIGRNKLLTNIGENRLNENREMAEKLNTLSNTILENIEKEDLHTFYKVLDQIRANAKKYEIK